MAREYQEGFQAWAQRISMIDCPYSKYSDEWYEWMDGWKQNWFTNLPGRCRPNGDSLEEQ